MFKSIAIGRRPAHLTREQHARLWNDGHAPFVSKIFAQLHPGMRKYVQYRPVDFVERVGDYMSETTWESVEAFERYIRWRTWTYRAL